MQWAGENLALSTSKNYRQVWKQRLSSRIGSMRVRDVRPVHIESVLQSIVHANPTLSKRTVQRAKALLSGIFTRAVALAVIDRNPETEIVLPRTRALDEEPYAYTSDKVEQILANLPGLARTVCAIAAYAGLTASELKDLEWSDYDSATGLLYVRRGVWKSTVGETKTATRRKPVPVIARLRSLLDAHAASVPSHRPDQWMFSSSVGTPNRPGEPRKPIHSAHTGKGRFNMARLSRFQARAGYDALQPERARTDRTADSPAQARLAGHSHALYPDSDAGCSGRDG
jgi:integrase